MIIQAIQFNNDDQAQKILKKLSKSNDQDQRLIMSWQLELALKEKDYPLIENLFQHLKNFSNTQIIIFLFKIQESHGIFLENI